MGSLRQQLVALLALLLFGTLQAHAQTVVSALATVADIQTKINAAVDNAQTIIQIAGGIVVGTLPAGTSDMGSQWIKLDKRGVTLSGSTDPSNPTIFQTGITTVAANGALGKASCLSDYVVGPPASGDGVALLQVCGQAETIIENIIFKNTDPTPYDSPFGAEKGIYINALGISSTRPSYVRNCQFLDLWRSTGPSGIAVEFGTPLEATPKHWVIQDNNVNGTRQGVYLNANDEVRIVNNSFTRFWTGVRQGDNQVSTGITITGNSFIGGWPSATLAPAGVQGISFSAAASSQNAPKNWLIQGNKISGVNTAFEIRYPSSSSPAYSMVGMDINTNGIEANFQCPTCYNVLNTSPAQPVVSNNWWGGETPDFTKFVSTASGAPAITVEPWITSFTASTCSNGLGFCPVDITNSDTVIPVIVSVVITPPLVSAGQSFLVTVTLEAPISRGTLTLTSTPPGITCPASPVQITSTDNPISVVCTAPTATAVLTAGLRGTTQAAETSAAAEQAAQVYADAVDSPAELAAPEAAVQVASLASVASSQQARVAQQQLPGSTRYTLTATVTADAVAEADAQVKVCQNTPWPFRAAASGCRQCAYNCATGVFACTGCSCYCPKAQSLGNQVNTPGHTYKPDYNSYSGPGYKSQGESSPDAYNQPGYTPEDKPGYDSQSSEQDYNQPGYVPQDESEYDSQNRLDHGTYQQPDYGSEGQSDYGSYNQQEKQSEVEPGYQSPDQSDHNQYRYEDQQGQESEDKRGYEDRPEYDPYNQPTGYGSDDTPSSGSPNKPDDDSYKSRTSEGKPSYESLEEGEADHDSYKQAGYGSEDLPGHGDGLLGDRDEFEPTHKAHQHEDHETARREEEEEGDNYGEKPHMHMEDGGRRHRSVEDSEYGMSPGEVDVEHGDDEEHASSKIREPAYRDTGYKTDHVDAHGDEEEHASSKTREPAYRDTNYKTYHVDGHGRSEYIYARKHSDAPDDGGEAELATSDALAQRDTHQRGDESAFIIPEEFRRGDDSVEITTEESHDSGLAAPEVGEGTAGDSGHNRKERSDLAHEGDQQASESPPESATDEWLAQFWKRGSPASLMHQSSSSAGGGRKLLSAEARATTSSTDATTDGSSSMPFALKSSTMWQRPILTGSGYQDDAQLSATVGQPDLVGSGSSDDAQQSATVGQPDLVGSGSNDDAQQSATVSQPDLVDPGYKADAQLSATMWQPYLIGPGYKADAGCSSQELDCVCAPSPLVVGAGCTGVTYDACTNQLSCTNAAPQWPPWYRF